MIESNFPLPVEIKDLPLKRDVVISDRCQDLRKHPHWIKILVLTPKGLLEAGKCRADFYARNMEDVYLWLRLLSLYRP